LERVGEMGPGINYFCEVFSGKDGLSGRFVEMDLGCGSANLSFSPETQFGDTRFRVSLT
jgi:hypothetical protein